MSSLPTDQQYKDLVKKWSEADRIEFITGRPIENGKHVPVKEEVFGVLYFSENITEPVGNVLILMSTKEISLVNSAMS